MFVFLIQFGSDGPMQAFEAKTMSEIKTAVESAADQRGVARKDIRILCGYNLKKESNS